jgi:hypothetical protein
VSRRSEKRAVHAEEYRRRKAAEHHAELEALRSQLATAKEEAESVARGLRELVNELHEQHVLRDHDPLRTAEAELVLDPDMRRRLYNTMRFSTPERCWSWRPGLTDWLFVVGGQRHIEQCHVDAHLEEKARNDMLKARLKLVVDDRASIAFPEARAAMEALDRRWRPMLNEAIAQTQALPEDVVRGMLGMEPIDPPSANDEDGQ